MRIGRWVAPVGATLLVIAISGIGMSAQSPPVERVALDVPFLSQTEDLCGGAAAAMLFRYWGDRHASVQQFEQLVDHSSGGIADAVLIDAIRHRGWDAQRLDGSEELLRSEIRAGRPPILLIEDRPGRYHYVVAVGLDAANIALHDPTWGPSRMISRSVFTHAWRSTNFWMLRVTPRSGVRTSQAPQAATVAGIDEARTTAAPSNADTAVSRQTSSEADASSCDARLEHALADLEVFGLNGADELLLPLTRTCGDRAAPWRELAGVRFAQRRWVEASSLASTALARDPRDSYAADVLGSSRFMLDDVEGALRAWNRISKPTLDTVRITGLTRTRYALVVQALGLTEEQVLTADAFGVARRRLESLPDLSSTRLALRPDEDHFAVADIAVVERATLPRGPIQWAAAAAQAGLERELSIDLPGRTGQGETWSGDVRWWEHRPRVAVSFAAPLTTGPRGIWRFDAEWAAQTYGPEWRAQRETQTGGALSFSTWLSPNLRAGIHSGVVDWTTDGQARRRLVQAGVVVERRFRTDRIAATGTATRYIGADGFGVFDGSVVARTSREPRPLVLLARGGVTHTGAGAPLALWNGAGEGRSRAPLLRAHQLLHDGRIDGPVFGRTLSYATVELQHWFDQPRLVHVGAAAFVDAARAGSRPDWVTGAGTQTDVGVGLRLTLPGRKGAFRIDYAHGTRERAHAVFVGWQAE